jgi:hypothetical protein
MIEAGGIRLRKGCQVETEGLIRWQFELGIYLQAPTASRRKIGWMHRILVKLKFLMEESAFLEKSI